MTHHEEPAMPIITDGDPNIHVHYTGLTALEHAAIMLKVPQSGTPWLDDMIRQARVLDWAGRIGQKLHWFTFGEDAATAARCIKIARAMLAESEKQK